MNLAPRELDHLILHQCGFLAQKRLARGVKLNFTEAKALIATVLLEYIRDGKTVAELQDLGRRFLGKRQVQEGVGEMIENVQVSVHSPIHNTDGDLTMALHGSFLPVPPLTVFDARGAEQFHTDNNPGNIQTGTGTLHMNAGRDVLQLTVSNLADRPIQVGSHYHFTECNMRLEFDRGLAYGRRLNIAAGTAVRFEPGETKTVPLVMIGGKRVIRGGNDLCDGPWDPAKTQSIVEKCVAAGYKHKPEDVSKHPHKKAKTEGASISRAHYAEIFGPTEGDKISLGDTGLVVQIEKDFTVYGDECKFGGGKVLRDGMGQASGYPADECLDCVLTNAIVIDHSGIYKCDIGIKHGKIHAIGKAGNPDVTAGGIDTHIHYICPQQANEAIAAGVTSMFGGGSGPATGTNATTCTDGKWYAKMMLQATDSLPLNFGFSGKGNSCKPEGLNEMIQAGCCGLKLHEDWGSTPAAINSCLNVAEQHDIQVTIHTDTLNESCCLEETVAAFKGRTIHTYHSEGAGGGHAPDIIAICQEPNVIPSSTNPTRPYTVNTIDEHVDMLMVCHHLDSSVPEDVAFAESRIRDKTIQAEDILHDLGAISIMSSDSQAMGRVGEVCTRTWQTAAKMKKQRGPLKEDESSGADNFRVKRYIAKYTINPAVAHGFGHVVGSVEVGKLADLVVWQPEYFGAKPQLVLKGGCIAWAQMGDPNASIPTPEPVMMRPMWGAMSAAAVAMCSVVFVSQASLDCGAIESYKLGKTAVAVKGCRTVGKKDMRLNNALPKITVDPETYVVKADGVELLCEPASVLPLAQRYFLF